MCMKTMFITSIFNEANGFEKPSVHRTYESALKAVSDYVLEQLGETMDRSLTEEEIELRLNFIADTKTVIHYQIDNLDILIA